MDWPGKGIWQAVERSLKLKLRMCGVAGQMCKGTGQYLHNRRAKVLVIQHFSKKRTLRQGAPQGGVLFPTLFPIHLWHPPSNAKEHTRSHLHRWPYIMVLWRLYHHSKLHAATSTPSDSSRHWPGHGLPKSNEKKTTFTIFSFSNQQQIVHLKLNGQAPHQDVYKPRHLPGSQTYPEKPAQQEPGQSKDQASLDEETILHR